MPRKPVAVILAGGSARRMGGVEKPLQLLQGKSLLQHVINNIRADVDGLVINTNSHFPEYKEFGFPVVADVPAEERSPLIGVYSALCWYKAQKTECSHLLTVPADVPFVPDELVTALVAAASDCASGLVTAESAGQKQPLFALWPFARLPALEAEIKAGNLGCKYVLDKLGACAVTFDNCAAQDFFNINTLEDLARLDDR